MRGLIIRSPHIDNILAGKKTWEMRSRKILIRETIALIKGGSGCVVGIADVVESLGPLSIQERLANETLHCITAEMWGDPICGKYKFAWVLDKVRPLARSIPYTHRKGAQMFVILDEQVQQTIASSFARG